MVKGLQSKHIERLDPESNRFYLGLEDPVARYAVASQFVQGKTVLDVACGIGYCSRLVKKHGALNVVGGDISVEAIDWASKHYVITGLEFVILNLERSLPFKDASFDVILSVETIEHLNRQEDFLLESYRVLKDEGHLIIVTCNRLVESKGSEVPLNPFHVREFSSAELQSALSKYFDEVIVMGISHVTTKYNILSALRMRLLPKLIAIFGNLVPRIINLITKLAFRKYRLVRIAEFTDSDFDALWLNALSGEKGPFELKPNCSSSRNLVAIARKKALLITR